MKRRPEDLIVFLGASLPAGEARRLVSCHVLPPARQGDVWRVLALRPRAIVLVDGLGGGQPAVWHQELLAALEAGVALYGGAGLGALRAAELAAQGMVGVGQIFEWYRDGVLVDDSEVAQRYAAHTLLEVTLKTGRTHQIRVHLAHEGHPIVGDALYGGVHRRVPGDLRALQRLERPFLHAERLAFTHPRDARRMEFSAPLASDLVAVLEDLPGWRTDE